MLNFLDLPVLIFKADGTNNKILSRFYFKKKQVQKAKIKHRAIGYSAYNLTQLINKNSKRISCIYTGIKGIGEYRKIELVRRKICKKLQKQVKTDLKMLNL